MDHRYGRHGPRAWLRWYKRHYPRPITSSVPVVRSTTVIYMYAPSQNERIIYIVTTTPSGNEYEDKNEPTSPRVPLQLPGGEKVKELSPGDSDLTNKAQIQAHNDAEDIHELSEGEKYILIIQERVGSRAKKMARVYTNGNYSISEYKRLGEVYQKAYEDYLYKEIGNDPAIKYILDAQEARLRDIAMHDSQTIPSQRDYHIRDLAVIRVLQMLNTPLDAVTEHLSQLHILADKYQDYYSNPREEVKWPLADSF